ncbi:MAG: MFS transporter [Anaerolineae bacterium]|nr:MFS transporter [Anaerolineae bacterium]
MSRSIGRFAALRHRDYRLVWSGNFISVIGTQMQFVAINWHIYKLLEGTSLTVNLLGREVSLNSEALGLGGVGLARIIPIFFFALVGGTMADVVNRRKLLILTNSAAAGFAAILALVSFAQHDTVWIVYLLTAAGAATSAFSSPAFQSIVPNLVPPGDLTNAISLNSIVRQVATIIGPVMAGVLLAKTNVGWVYAVNAVSFIAIVAALVLIQYRAGPAARDTGLGFAAILEGWRFVRGARIIWGSMLLDFFATLFSSARTMLPLVADQMLGMGAQGYGLLYTADAIGSLLAGVLVSLRKDIYRQGAVMLISVAFYGLATVFFGLSTNFAMSYLFFALIGASDTVSTIIRQTLRQTLTPDRLRGRMTGINQIFFMGGPQLGELEAGMVAAAFGVPFAIVSGGIATVALTGYIAWHYPRLRRYTSATMAEESPGVASAGT